ncbi:MAG: hypothetical protein EA382_09615 [Spirochaetaceae bacterium]|nr:MAG: hypothetical protein EA382_09615 [Spirochaetaceae bacterium]
MHLPGPFAIGTPETNGVRSAFESMILSASGWRAVFAADGDEQSRTQAVSGELLVIVALAARCYAESLPTESIGTPVVAVGCDTRPTGPLIVGAAVRALASMSVSARLCGVCASPEIMAYAASSAEIAGFFYVTASHNPIGHNGLKMGGEDGGVYDQTRIAAMIARLTELVDDPVMLDWASDALRAGPGDAERLIYDAHGRAKRAAIEEYTRSARETAVGPGPRASDAFAALTHALRSVTAGVVVDMNGSARASSIDVDFLRSCGLRVHAFNDTPGLIAHQIVPEGAGLEPCRSELTRIAGVHDGYEIGYTPDNDGDRGNLVVYDAVAREAVAIDAQTVFALVCVAELSWLVTTGALPVPGSDDRVRAAIVANGPTSLRIDRIADAFGVEVHRAEVGEANVVNRARELRSRGALVRILGEGSNGGNITHPAAVRDPLQTVLSALKLLHGSATDSTPAPATVWFSAIGATIPDPLSLSGIIRSMPRFTTTSSFESRAIMSIGNASHARLKRTFEAALPAEFALLRPRLHDELGVETYAITNYEGTRERPGPGHRTGDETGGLKVTLLDSHDSARGFLWMRGSGTEPVFRIMVDVEGDRPALEEYLLDRLRAMVTAAAS